MEQMKFLKWNDDMLVLLVGRQNGNTVIPTLDAYLKSLRLQVKQCKDLDSLKALCSTVQLHIPHVHNLVATKIKLSALCIQYRYCEDIAATYISIELEKISTSYCKESLVGSVIEELSDSCKSLLSVLYQSLPWKYLNIINCLLKLKYNNLSPHSLYIVEHLSFNVLFECSLIDRAELTICAAYLLYCKYKKMRPSYEHKLSLMKFMSRFNLDYTSFTEMQLLKDILQLKHSLNLSLADVAEEPCGKKCSFIKNYFQYIKENAKSLIIKARSIDPNVIYISDDEEDKMELNLMPSSDMQLVDNFEHASVNEAVKTEDTDAVPTTHVNEVSGTNTIIGKSQINDSVPPDNEDINKSVVPNFEATGTESCQQSSQISLSSSEPLSDGLKVKEDIKIEPHSDDKLALPKEPLELTMTGPDCEERVVRILDLCSIKAADEEEKRYYRTVITTPYVSPPARRVFRTKDTKSIRIVDEKTENDCHETDLVPVSEDNSQDIISSSELLGSKIIEQTPKESKEIIINPIDCIEDRVEDLFKKPEIPSHSSSKEVVVKQASMNVNSLNDTMLQDLHQENKNTSSKLSKSCTSNEIKEMSMDVGKGVIDVKGSKKCDDRIPNKESDAKKVTTSHSKPNDNKEPLKVVPEQNKGLLDVLNRHNNTTPKKQHSANKEKRSNESKDILTDENKLITNNVTKTSALVDTPKKSRTYKLTDCELDIGKSKEARLHADMNKDCDSSPLTKATSHKAKETKQKVDRHEPVPKKSKENNEKEKTSVKELPPKRSRHSSDSREKKGHQSHEDHHKKSIANTSKENKENGEYRTHYSSSRENKEKGKSSIKDTSLKPATKSKDNNENGIDATKSNSPKLKESKNQKDKLSNKQHIDCDFLFKNIPCDVPEPDIMSPKKRSPSRPKESKDKDKGQDQTKIWDCANRLESVTDTVAPDDTTSKKTAKHKSKDSKEKDHRCSSKRKVSEENKSKGKEECKSKDKHEHRSKTTSETKSKVKSDVKETEKTTTRQPETKSECTSSPKDTAYKFKKEALKVSTYSRSENKTKLVSKITELKTQSSELGEKDSISDIQDVVRGIMNEKEFSNAEQPPTNIKSLSLVELHSILDDGESINESQGVAKVIAEVLPEPERKAELNNDIIVNSDEVITSVNEVTVSSCSTPPTKQPERTEDVPASHRNVPSFDNDTTTIDNKSIVKSAIVPRESPGSQVKLFDFSIENIVRDNNHADHNKKDIPVALVEQPPIVYDNIKENKIQVEQSINACRYRNIHDVPLEPKSLTLQRSHQYDHINNITVSASAPKAKQIQLPIHNYEFEKHMVYNQQQPMVRVSIPMSPNMSAYKVWDYETNSTNGVGLSQMQAHTLNASNDSPMIIDSDPVNLTIAHNQRNVAATDKITNGKSPTKSVGQTDLKSSLKSDKIKPPRAISFSDELRIKQFQSDEAMSEMLIPPRQNSRRKRQASILSTDPAELSAQKPKTSRINDLRLDMDIDRAFALVDKQRDKSNNRRGAKRRAPPPNVLPPNAPINVPTYLSQPANVQPTLNNGTTLSYSNVTPSGAYVASPLENARVTHSVSQFPETPSPEPFEIMRTCFSEDEPLSDTLQELRKYNYSESDIQLLWESMKTHTHRLPFKKRHNTVPSSTGQAPQPEVSYPATPMISILELQRMPNAVPPPAMHQPPLTHHYPPPTQSQPNMLPYIFHVDNPQHAGMYYPQ